MSEDTPQVRVTITAHRTDADQYHCWVQNADAVPDAFFDEIERVEGEYFGADRKANEIVTEHLPVEGNYEHSPIEIGEVICNSEGDIIDIHIDLETAKDQLQSHGYL